MILHTSIRKVHTNVATISGDTIDDVICTDKDGGIVEIDKNAVNTKIAEYDSQAYARNRKDEYDALNQFELMTDDAANGTTTHADAINAIKAKYPKG